MMSSLLEKVPNKGRLQGWPVNFSDFKLVLDNRVYRNLDGRWADLFNKLKWDTIKSVVKSVTGLQGRKFKVSEAFQCLLASAHRVCT